MGPVNNNNFNWERALLKRRNGGNTNPQGNGKVNIDDIILADDLLEKCRALDFEDNQAITDWTFSDICVQDSCGVLQSAFEDSVDRGFGVTDFDRNIIYEGDGQTIVIQDDVRTYYTISYIGGKYKVQKSTLA